MKKFTLATRSIYFVLVAFNRLHRTTTATILYAHSFIESLYIEVISYVFDLSEASSSECTPSPVYFCLEVKPCPR